MAFPSFQKTFADFRIRSVRHDGADAFDPYLSAAMQGEKQREHRAFVNADPAGGIREIDASGAHALEEIITSLQARGIAVLLCGVAERPLHILEAVGAIDAMNAGNHVFSSLPDAIAHAQQHVRRHLAPRD